MGKELIYSYIKEIAMRLKDSRRFGAASVMIGAGFSKNAKSKGAINVQPPNWSELADRMYCELYPQSEDWDEKQKEEWKCQRIVKTSGKNVTKLAEEYIANFDRNKINHLIEEAIADDSFFPGELHKKLLRLCWADIFTTNYDTLLERTSDLIFRESNYKIVYSQNDLPGSIKPRIVKLHGSIPQIKPYVICDEDYRTYPIKYPAMVNTVQQAMLETRLCLIGFSGDDPNFQSWLGWLRDNMGEYCPKIYLIGIYDNLSEPERKLLENKQITIVDISDLADKKDENRYYTAISEFLNLLEKFQGDEDRDIYRNRPFSREDRFWEPKDKIEYIRIMEGYSDKVSKWMQPYILLPEKIRSKYESYFSDHFQIILRKCREQCPVNTIGNIIKILRKCSIVLDDASADFLEEICENFNQNPNLTDNILKSIIEIELYLLEMYRIDGRRLDYEKKMCQFEEHVNRMSWYKNEMIIEKIKNEIGAFRYKEAMLLIEKIEENSFEYKIKKAGFYKQLSEYDKANKILNECSAELAQMKLSDDVYSSYLGYLNLCYRVGRWDIPNEYSDLNYYENEYNTRRIIVKQREKLGQEFFKSDCKEEKNIPFNLNTGKNITYTICGSDVLYKKCFCFLITLDKLCLPLFSDQIELFPRVIDKIIDSSKYKYWKISLVIRTNDEKVINQTFTRKVIETISKDEIKKLFDSLLSLSKLYRPDDSYDRKKYIVSEKNILNILSRLVVFLPDENVGVYLQLLSGLSLKNDTFVVRDINRIIERISTRFNSKVATMCQNIIFMDFGHEYHLCSYFDDFSFEINKENVKEYYNNAISLIKKDDLTERDCGISQLLVLWKNFKIEGYKADIVKALWKNKNDVLPPSNLYFQFVWEELPHPDSVKFSELYYSYLLEDRYVRSVTDTGYLGNNSANSVRYYLNFFYSTSKVSLRKCEKVLLDEKLALFLLNTAYDYVMHEKSLLERESDFLGEKYDAEIKFELIGELIALVYIEAVTEEIVEPFRKKISWIKDILVSHNVSAEALNMVEYIENKKYNLCMGIFENAILSKNKKNYSGVFTGIQCLLFYLEFQSEKDYDLNRAFENFMGAIKYLDIEYAKTIWIEMALLIKRSFFMNENAQKYIATAIYKCVDLYIGPAQDGERYYLDGLYNCVKALHGYYIRISECGGVITSELKSCVEMAKGIENYELRNIWG